MSSFFTIPGSQKKRKRPAAADAPKKRIATSKPRGKAPPPNKKAVPAPKRVERDESISGSDSDEFDDEDGASVQRSSQDESDASEHEGETAAERRLRLAERYLDNVRHEVEDEYAFDAEDIDRDLIAERLQEDVAESKGKIYRKLAAEFSWGAASQHLLRWNSQNVNSVATCAPYAYTVTSDSYLTKWRIQDLPQHQWPQTTKKKPKKPPAPPKKRPEKVAFRRGDTRRAKDREYKGHVGAMLSVAASQDGKYVVTGGADNRLVVYDAHTLQPLKCFYQHRDDVTGLAFRRGTNQLYSCSKDRTVKVWGVEELAYVETLYGHADEINAIDALSKEVAVSVGGRDRTARYWRIVEETQLVFRGSSSDKKPRPGVDPKSLAHEGSMDQVAMIDDDHFVTGSDNGNLSLWSIKKKKPVFVLSYAHGLDAPLDISKASAERNPQPQAVPPPQPRWITALHAIPYSDVFFSGSWDGYVRIWKLSDDKRKIESLGTLGGTDGNVAQVNGVNGAHASTPEGESAAAKVIRGVVNGISTFERGDRGKDGLCVVAAIGKETRLGRWKLVEGGRNGVLVFEIPRTAKALANGVHSPSADGDE